MKPISLERSGIKVSADADGGMIIAHERSRHIAGYTVLVSSPEIEGATIKSFDEAQGLIDKLIRPHPDDRKREQGLFSVLEDVQLTFHEEGAEYTHVEGPIEISELQP